MIKSKLYQVYSYNRRSILATFSSEEKAKAWMEANEDNHRYGSAWRIEVSYLDDFTPLED